MDLRERKKGIGGSDVAPILGLSRFRTAVEIWYDKLSDEVQEEPRPDDPNTSMMYWGKAFEREILDAYTKVTGNCLIRGEDIGQLKHPDIPWLMANVDAFTYSGGEKILVEAKNCEFSRDGDWGNEWTDVIPIEYLCQIQHYLHVTGLKRADVAVRINGLLKVYEVHKSDEVIKKMMPALDRFWNHNVKNNIAPTASNLSDVRIIYPDAVNQEKTASDEQITDICQIKQLNTEKSVINKKLDKLKTPIAEYMGESNLLVANDGSKVATFNKNKSGNRVFRIVRRAGG